MTKKTIFFEQTIAVGGQQQAEASSDCSVERMIGFICGLLKI